MCSYPREVFTRSALKTATFDNNKVTGDAKMYSDGVKIWNFLIDKYVPTPGVESGSKLKALLESESHKGLLQVCKR